MIDKYNYFDACVRCGNPFMEKGNNSIDIINELNNYGIKRGVLLLEEQYYYNPHDAQDKVLSVVKEIPNYYGILSVVPSVTGEMTPADKLLAHFTECLAGLLVALDKYNIPARAVFLSDWYSVAERRKVPVWYRAENMDDLYYVADVLAHFPNLNFILSVKETWPNGRKIYPLAAKYSGLKICLSDFYLANCEIVPK